MLVLSRRTQEAVVVGSSTGFEHLLKVTVLKIASGQVRLGFEIDKAVPVQRWELWQHMAGQGQPPLPAQGIAKPHMK